MLTASLLKMEEQRGREESRKNALDGSRLRQHWCTQVHAIGNYWTVLPVGYDSQPRLESGARRSTTPTHRFSPSFLQQNAAVRSLSLGTRSKPSSWESVNGRIELDGHRCNRSGSWWMLMSIITSRVEGGTRVGTFYAPTRREQSEPRGGGMERPWFTLYVVLPLAALPPRQRQSVG